MKKIEALEHYNENYVEPNRLEKLNKLDEYLEKHKEELAAKFVEAFKNICIKAKCMQKAGNKSKIGYITFSLLRTNILEKKYVYALDAYSNLWFFDRCECQVEYDVNWAFKFLDDFEEELEEKRKHYINKILKPDVEKIKLKEVDLYNERIVKLARYAISEAVRTQAYLDIDKEEVLEVRVGEYKGFSEVVFKEDTRVKDAVAIKRWLEAKYEYEYVYEVLKNLDLSHGDYEGIDLSYADLRGSNLSNSNFKKCLLVGTNFEGADLSFSDFRDANIQGVNLNRTSLEGCKFLNKDISNLYLDDEQRKNIIVE